MKFDIAWPDDPTADLARFSERGAYVDDNGTEYDTPARHLDFLAYNALQAVRAALHGDRAAPARTGLVCMVNLAQRAALAATDQDEARNIISHLQARIDLLLTAQGIPCH